MTNCIFQIAACSTIGARKAQEDTCDFRLLGTSLSAVHTAGCSDKVLMVLADGMGGHVGGARASQTACSRFLEAYVQSAALPFHSLKHALDAANDMLACEVSAHHELKGMGCTLIGAFLEDDLLRWVSVGDSLLFMIRGGKLHQLNADHSMMPVLTHMVQRGELSATELQGHPHRHVLRSALTGEPIPMIDLPSEGTQIIPGDWIVLASDGIAALAEDEIVACVDQHLNGGAPAVAHALIDAVVAKRRPKQDNATVLIAHANML